MKPVSIDERIAALREAFDATFAAPVETTRARTIDLLAIRFGAHGFAVPVAELSGVQTRRAVVALPAAPPLCLGLVGVRGRLVAAYDLAAMLRAPRPEKTPWLLVSRLDPELAFASAEAERYVRVDASAIVPRDVAPTDPCVGALSYEGVGLTVLSVDRLVAKVAAAAETHRR